MCKECQLTRSWLEDLLPFFLGITPDLFRGSLGHRASNPNHEGDPLPPSPTEKKKDPSRPNRKEAPPPPTKRAEDTRRRCQHSPPQLFSGTISSFYFGGCPKNGLPQKGFPFFSRVTEQLSQHSVGTWGCLTKFHFQGCKEY